MLYKMYCYTSLVLVISARVASYELTILHTNDVHARFEQINKYGADCSVDDAAAGKCFGGVARRHTKIKDIRNGHDNVLLLDAGDQFMGTLWFFVHRGNATSYFMNQLGYDVMCLGNHEFDLGVDPLASFLGNVSFDVVSSSVDVTNEPKLSGLLTKSVIKNVGGENIGVIGYITPETKIISEPGPTVTFEDVISSVSAEVAVLQSQSVTKILALGHAGFRMDQQVAAIDGVDVVVGGHTDTFLYTGEPPSDETPEGLYPVVVSQPRGGRALVVQDFTYGKYLGYLNVTFNANGDVTSWSGNPILLDSSIEQGDADTLRELATWRLPVDEIKLEKVGLSLVELDGRREHCRLRECNLGNMLADAMIDYYVTSGYNFSNEAWAPAAIALQDSGSIRSSIQKGMITAGDVNNVQPFRNEVDMIRINGSNLRHQLEISVSEYDVTEKHGRFLQFSGLKVTYDLQQPAMRRVHDVQVRCLTCAVPSYSPLQDEVIYNVLLPTYLIKGGDGYQFEPIEHLRFNTLDVEVTFKYLGKHGPVYPAEEGRITFVTKDTDADQVGGAQGQHDRSSLAFVLLSGLLLSLAERIF
ncbi:5NTD-like protein [Mya arenaria]|uniref:5'-nucleotidase n=1 Tax=Mya arenaria TaxID=6604 RepID=A0ABY7EBY2_MYAAR|nr:5NTD-like protein [Mya arenaria]